MAARHCGASDMRGGRGVFAAVEAGRCGRVGSARVRTRRVRAGVVRLRCTRDACGCDVGERVKCGCGARRRVRRRTLRSERVLIAGLCGCGSRCGVCVRCDVLDEWARSDGRVGNYGAR